MCVPFRRISPKPNAVCATRYICMICVTRVCRRARSSLVVVGSLQHKETLLVCTLSMSLPFVAMRLYRRREPSIFTIIIVQLLPLS